MEVFLAALMIWTQPVLIVLLLVFIVWYSIKNSPTQEDYDRATYDAVERHKKRRDNNV